MVPTSGATAGHGVIAVAARIFYHGWKGSFSQD
jgi:hypothetical protein